MGKKVLLAAIAGKSKLFQDGILYSFRNFAGVGRDASINNHGTFTSIHTCGLLTACDLCLINPPFIGNNEAAIHTTNGNNHSTLLLFCTIGFKCGGWGIGTFNFMRALAHQAIAFYLSGGDIPA